MSEAEFYIKSYFGEQSYGALNKEVLAYPMSNVPFMDADLAERLRDPETYLVHFSQQDSNDEILSELNQLSPFLRSSKRNVVTFYKVDLRDLFSSDVKLKEAFLSNQNKIQATYEDFDSLNFTALRTDVQETMERLSNIVDFDQVGNFGFRHVAPGTKAAGWYFDAWHEYNIVRAVRGLSVSGMDIALKNDFNVQSQHKGKFDIHRYGSTDIGLNVFFKNPADGCPLHRISETQLFDEHRWSYIIDGTLKYVL